MRRAFAGRQEWGLLVGSAAFTFEGVELTRPVPFDQSVEEYVGSLGTRASLSRVTLGHRADEFSHDLRDLFARHGVDRVRYDVVAARTPTAAAAQDMAAPRGSRWRPSLAASSSSQPDR